MIDLQKWKEVAGQRSEGYWSEDFNAYQTSMSFGIHDGNFIGYCGNNIDALLARVEKLEVFVDLVRDALYDPESELGEIKSVRKALEMFDHAPR